MSWGIIEIYDGFLCQGDAKWGKFFFHNVISVISGCGCDQ